MGIGFILLSTLRMYILSTHELAKSDHPPLPEHKRIYFYPSNQAQGLIFSVSKLIISKPIKIILLLLRVKKL